MKTHVVASLSTTTLLFSKKLLAVVQKLTTWEQIILEEQVLQQLPLIGYLDRIITSNTNCYKSSYTMCVGYGSNHGCVVPWLLRHRHPSSQCCLTQSSLPAGPGTYVGQLGYPQPTSRDLHLHLHHPVQSYLLSSIIYPIINQCVTGPDGHTNTRS